MNSRFNAGTVMYVGLMIAGLGLALRQINVSASSSTAANRPVFAPSPDNKALRTYAWSVFKKLTVDFGDGKVAKWEKEWTPKCDIPLGVKCAAASDDTNSQVSLMTVDTMVSNKNSSAQTENGKPDVGSSLDQRIREVETQNLRSLGRPLQLPRFGTSHAPILASVMMHAAAQGEMWRLTTVPPTWKDVPNFPAGVAGAMFAKAIWTVRPLDSGTPGACLTSHTPPITTVTWNNKSKLEEYRSKSKSMPATIPDPQSGLAAPGVQQAWSFKNINCPGATSNPTYAAISITNFHAFGVHITGVNSVPSAQIDDASAEAHGRHAVQWDCGGPDCVALMMGIHIMAKISPKDGNFGSDSTPVWVFMTFWWTGEDNGQGWPEPWKYYALNVTTSPRIDHADGTADNIIFNPYLEGVIGPAGAQTNCVNCHSVARYNAKMTGDQLRANGSALGNLPIGQTDAGHCGDYLGDPASIPVDRVWSVTSLLDPSTPSDPVLKDCTSSN